MNKNTAVKTQNKTLTNVTKVTDNKAVALTPKPQALALVVPKQMGGRMEVGSANVPFGIRYINQ